MKRLNLLMLPAAAAILVLLLAGCNKSSLDSSLFTVEVVENVRYVHNHAPQIGGTSDVNLELLGKIGKLDGVEERDILYDPVDAARLSNGDILILERDGCTVKRYNKNYEFVSSFGQRGQGPGDFLSPYLLRLAIEKNEIFVADSRISVFSLNGSFRDSFKPNVIARFGSIGVQYRTAGMVVLSGLQVILPSPPSLWIDSGDHKLLSVYDKTGAVTRSFGAVRLYETQELSLNANIVYFTNDSSENIYVAYAHQNRIIKYSSDGKMIFSSDRSLPYEIENVIKVEVFKSGDMEREFPWPSVTSVSKGIGIDARGRLWVLTFLKQPNKFGEFEDEGNLSKCYEFDVFDMDGILMFKVPFPNVLFDNFSIYDDRIYLIDFQNEACVYEYKIAERN